MSRKPLRGTLRCPSDKSLSHRAILFGAMADGVSQAENVLRSDDVDSTIACVRALGARINIIRQSEMSYDLEIVGWGAGGPISPSEPLDCGNSGTTARLLFGLVAGYPITATLVGDVSLSKRPMERVAGPLREMGAVINLADSSTLPATITGSDTLSSIEYRSPHASAQVKTALALAALRADGVSVISEPVQSRTMTEEMFPYYGLELEQGYEATEPFIRVAGGQQPMAARVKCGADPSSIAFFVCAALVVPNSDITFTEVYLNPSRMGFIKALMSMGADVEVKQMGAESVHGPMLGQVQARYSPKLCATLVQAPMVPQLIDEIPILALIASQAQGTTRFEGIEELRVKESDRLAHIVTGLEALGASVKFGVDWLEVTGPTTLVAPEDSLEVAHDHRLAMTWAVANLIARGQVKSSNPEMASVSYPTFYGDLDYLQNNHS